ncbi:MAG: NAD-dependent succinate-semialdehyde dehydrogenase [Deltaproteobacteria bacterium]|nr:NAD-dependent succinate-semialdehyde dehydrogenase [Deltaproteobacteria bacterium]
MIKTINPSTEEQIQSYALHDEQEVEKILDDLQGAQLALQNLNVDERARILKNIAQALRNQKEDFAKQMVLEMGKPLAQAQGEIEKCAWVCEHYASAGVDLLADQIIATEGQRSYIRFEPIGVVLAIMPWNFPFWQVFRCLAPHIMLGNTVALKHAPNTTGCAVLIQDLLQKLVPDVSLLKFLCLENNDVAKVIASKKIAAVSLTGSVRAGKSVAAVAGDNLKKTVLELGGSDPYIVLEDADLNQAVKTCVMARFNNTGQTCVAAKRFLVHQKIYKDFEEAFVEEIKTWKQGDPFNTQNKLGPLAREDLLQNLERQVSRAKQESALRCLLGGKRLPGQGYFFEPTVFSGVTAGSVLSQEEVFGPVASLFKVQSEEEAIALANDSPFGLGGAVFTKEQRGEEIAKQINAGVVAVNDMVKSDPRLPFGGVKESGYGCELGSFGFYEFANIKTVTVKSC